MITKQFLTAGEAIFTASNPQGEHYTFRCSRPRDFNPESPRWFISLLTGPDNTSDYTYLGMLLPGKVTKTDDAGDYAAFTDPAVILTKASKYRDDSKPVKIARWLVKLVWWERGSLPEGYKIEHCGRCGKCGRTLTTPDSILSGLGPVCAGRE